MGTIPYCTAMGAAMGGGLGIAADLTRGTQTAGLAGLATGGMVGAVAGAAATTLDSIILQEFGGPLPGEDKEEDL